MVDYKMTKSDEVEILADMLAEMTIPQILSYGEVREFFLEKFNNEILERWEQQELDRVIEHTPESTGLFSVD